MEKILGTVAAWSPQRFFVLFGLLVGLILCGWNPPYGVPDEPSHMYKAWSVAGGNLRDVRQDNQAGQMVPESVPRTALEDFRLRPAHWGELFGRVSEPHMFVENPQYAIYAPVPYLPQTAGILIGQAIGTSPLGAHYLARVLNLLVFILLTALGIGALSRHWGWILAAVALLPMTMHQAASASADSMTLGLCFLVTGWFLGMDNGFVKTGRRYAGALLAFCLLALSKTGYIILGLLGFLRFPSMTNRQRWMLGGMLLAGLGMALLWGKLVSGLYVPLAQTVSPTQQLEQTASQPLTFLQLAWNIVNHAFLKGKNGFYQIIGVLGWLDVYLPAWIYMLYLLVIPVLMVLTFDGPPQDLPPALNWPQRGLIWVTLFLGTLLIFFWLYLSYNQVGATKIEGLQGRYFLPFLAPFLISIARPLWRFPYKVPALLVLKTVIWAGVFATLA